VVDAHDAPEHLARREVEPADRPDADPEVRLAARLLPGANGDEARKGSGNLEPVERLVVDRAEAPGAGLDRIPVRSKPSGDEACDVFWLGRLREQALQVR